ncbi:type II toxin-antitoxin system HicB family antitoxin [Methylobacter sp. sgz302048]|uniref:type II toxin-antitoxin system HicB family antitoxin n=1 Tax=Methylobacter sp. sgz302048 TaxID=3455945 RepID=UPI003FA0BA22
MMTKTDKISKETVEILSKAYARRLTPDETGGYVASIQEFPGCVAEGDTAEDAIKNLDKAAASWVEVALSNGYEIRDPVSFDGCSGKIALRIPRGLHKQVAELAELEETSINQLLVTAISQYLGSQRAFREMSEIILADMRKVMANSGIVSLYNNGSLTYVVAVQAEGNHYYSSSTTIEGRLTEKLFDLGSNISDKHQLGVYQK